MKRLCLLFLVLTVAAVAQQQLAPAAPAQRITNVVEHVFAPTYTDQYCAGFISKENYNHGNYLVAGAESPSATQFGQGDTIFLKGSGYAEGQVFSIIRELRDPNRNPAYAGQAMAVAAVGQPYQELGHGHVTAMRGGIAIALVDFSCTAMVAGDLVVPFVEKQPIQYRRTNFERFPAGPGSVNGRIVMAKEFDVILAAGHKVYLNVGSSQGVNVGDYFRAVRNYDPKKQEATEALAYKTQQTEDTMKHQPNIMPGTYAELPKRALGEMIVLSVTPTSATAMITMSLEHINVGELVEKEDSFAAPPPPPPGQPPTITCEANPGTVRSGEPSTITAIGLSPDNRPLTYNFGASGGRLTPSGAQATLDTTGLPAGLINIDCTTTNDSGLSARASTTVNVVAASAAPEASKCGTIEFSRDRRRPARVDNEAKAILDDCALRLQRDPGARGVIVGNASPNEPNAMNLAGQRAANTKEYLVREKGIDPSRLEVRTGTGGTQTVDIWIVPAGATF